MRPLRGEGRLHFRPGGSQRCWEYWEYCNKKVLVWTLTPKLVNHENHEFLIFAIYIYIIYIYIYYIIYIYMYIIYIYIYVSRFFFVRHVIHYFLGWNHLNLQSGAPPLWVKIVGHIFLDDQCPKLTTVTSIIHYCIYSDMEVSNKNRVLLLFVHSSKFIAGFSLKPSSVRFGGSPGPGQLSLRGRQCQVLRSWKSSMDGLVLLRKATGFSMDFHC